MTPLFFNPVRGKLEILTSGTMLSTLRNLSGIIFIGSLIMIRSSDSVEISGWMIILY